MYMINLRYAILGSIIPVFVVFYYTDNIIDELYNEINVLKDNGYCEHYKVQSFDVTVTTYNPTRHQTDSTPNQTADGTIIKPWKARRTSTGYHLLQYTIIDLRTLVNLVKSMENEGNRRMPTGKLILR